MSSSQEYAAEGFDPTKLKMAQLRSILLQHGVAPPSTARKADLVAEFNRHIAPQAAELRSQNANIVASGSGIIDMRAERTDDSSVENTPAKGRRKSRTPATGRKSVATARAEPEVLVPAPAALPAIEEPEVPVKRKPGRPRKSAPAAVAQPKEVSFKADESPSEDKAGRSAARKRDESAFSDYNPFQSGSEASPDVGPAAKAAAAARRARRKTTDGRTSKLAARSDEDEMDVPEAVDRSAQTKSALPKSRTVPALKNYMDASIAASTPPRIIGKVIKRSREMFSPPRNLGPGDESKDEGQTADIEDETEDEADEPEDDTRAVTALAATPSKQPKAKRFAHEDLSTSQKLSQLLWSFLLLSFVAYGIWYAHESRAVGYCDTGSRTNSILVQREAQAVAAAAAAADDDDAALLGQVVPTSVRPSCATCPIHAECSDGKLLGCSSQDYVLQPSWLDFVPLGGSIFPLGWTRPSCVPDTQKLVLASELASAVNHYVAKWKGDVICGYEGPHKSIAPLVKKDGRPELRYALPEASVRDAMFESRDSEQISPELFEQLWDLALEDFAAPGSNIVRLSSNSSSSIATDDILSQNDALLSARAPILTIGCRSRLAFRAWLKRTRIYFFIVASAVMGITYLRRRWRLAREERKKVAELVQVALERLQEQEYAHAVDPVINPEPYVPTSHLRDHVLRSEHSTNARQRLWKKVARVVEENANVRTRQANRRGEWLRVWEWVGVVGSAMSQLSTPQSAQRGGGRRASPDKSRLGVAATAAADMDTDEEMRQLQDDVKSSPLRAR